MEGDWKVLLEFPGQRPTIQSAQVAPSTGEGTNYLLHYLTQ